MAKIIRFEVIKKNTVKVTDRYNDDFLSIFADDIIGQNIYYDENKRIKYYHYKVNKGTFKVIGRYEIITKED